MREVLRGIELIGLGEIIGKLMIRIWVEISVVEMHHLTVVHVVHSLKVSLVVLISRSTVLAIEVLPLPGSVSLVSHVVISPSVTSRR